jgi:PTS system nitrogen regulatory IIA component
LFPPARGRVAAIVSLDSVQAQRYHGAMNLSDYTTPDGFLPHLSCTTLEQAVTQLVDGLNPGFEAGSRAELIRDVMQRETEGSTAIGGGLIIPHARSRGTRRLGVAVATLQQPLSLLSDDGRPVDVIILLVGPPGDPVAMLRLLARLARLVRRESFLDTLRAAPDAARLREAFHGATVQAAD